MAAPSGRRELALRGGRLALSFHREPPALGPAAVFALRAGMWATGGRRRREVERGRSMQEPAVTRPAVGVSRDWTRGERRRRWGEGRGAWESVLSLPCLQ